VNDAGELRKREVRNRDGLGLVDDDRGHAVAVHRRTRTSDSFV
jgi:hypothetical protein